MAETKQELLELDEDTQKGRFLIFVLDKQSYGIEIMYVTEIIDIQPFMEVPELPEYIRGVINLRGRMIPVVDVRLRFKKQRREYDDRTCVIVINIEDISIGLIVDSVSEVLHIPEVKIVPPEVSNIANKYIKGIGKTGNTIKLLLDCNKLLNEEETEDFSEIETMGA